MENFYLGYLNGNQDFDNPNDLIQFKSAAEAENTAEEWCKVQANSLEEAKLKYHKTFEDWKTKFEEQ